jgi:hypothetical protein
MRRFLAWYQVLLASELVIMFTVPIFLAKERFSCGGTSYAVTFIVWMACWISITDIAPPQYCYEAPVFNWMPTGLMGPPVINWFFYGLAAGLCIFSICVFHKKPGPPLGRIRNMVSQSYKSLSFLGLMMNISSFLVSGFSPAGLVILAPATLLYFYSRRIYLTKEHREKRGRRIAEIEEDVTKEIIAGHQDVLLSEVQDILAASTVPWARYRYDYSYDFIPIARALVQRIRFMGGILQSLRENKSMSIDSLKAAFPTRDFPAAILDLCKRFNLAIQGDTIQIASGVDPNSFLSEIDKMFTTWKRNEAAKLAKI